MGETKMVRSDRPRREVLYCSASPSAESLCRCCSALVPDLLTAEQTGRTASRSLRRPRVEKRKAWVRMVPLAPNVSLSTGWLITRPEGPLEPAIVGPKPKDIPSLVS